MTVVCCQVEVSTTGRSLFKGMLYAIECGVSQRELENSTRRRPRPAGAVDPRKKKLQYFTGSSVLNRFTVDEVSET